MSRIIICFLILAQLWVVALTSIVNSTSVDSTVRVKEFSRICGECAEAPSVRCLSRLLQLGDALADEHPKTLQALVEILVALSDDGDVVLGSVKRWVYFEMAERHFASEPEFTAEDFEVLLNAAGADKNALYVVMRIMSSSISESLVRDIQISGSQFVSLSLPLQSRLVGQFPSVIRSAVLKDWIMSIVVFLGQERLLSALLVEYLEREEEDGTFMNALISQVLQFQFDCDKGDWSNSGPFARFYRVFVEDAADFLVNFEGPLPHNMSGAVAMMILNRSVLNTTSPDLESTPIVGFKFLQSPKEAFTIVDFYLAMTNFGPYLFDDAVEFNWRRSRVIAFLNDVAEDLLSEKDNLEGASFDKIRLYALKCMLQENSYRLVHLLLTDPTKSGVALSTENVNSLVWECDHCALAVAQLLMFAANGRIGIPENANPDISAIVQLFAMFQTRISPCDSENVITVPSLLASNANPAVFRAYLLFSFGVTLRHSVSLGTMEQSPAVILSAANALITNFCQKRIGSQTNITLVAV